MQLLCVGDVALTDRDLSGHVWEMPWGVGSGKDLRVLLNWELAIGNTINPTPRVSGPRLLSYPGSWRVIQRWSPGFVTLATNHILDAGDEGLAHTIESLRRAGFTTVGAGRTQEEIKRPLLWETAEGRLAVVNWVFPEAHPDWMAVPGPNCWPGVQEAERTIQALKRRADWVLVVTHWSDEEFSYPRPEDRVIAHELAGMGADLVVGHHPHVVRGMETIGSCPVFYSVGNFYFSDLYDAHMRRVLPEAPRNREGLGVQVSFRRGRKPEWQVLSFRRAQGRVDLDPARRAARRMKRASYPLRRLQGAEYAKWYAPRRRFFDKWGSMWHFGFRRLGVSGTIRRLYQKARLKVLVISGNRETA